SRLARRVIIEDDVEFSIHVSLSHLPLDRVFSAHTILPVALFGQIEPRPIPRLEPGSIEDQLARTPRLYEQIAIELTEVDETNQRGITAEILIKPPATFTDGNSQRISASLLHLETELSVESKLELSNSDVLSNDQGKLKQSRS